MEKILKNTYICYPGGKHKALTMSYDDGKIFDKRLVEIFNKHGIKGTFHLNGGLAHGDDHVNLSELKTVYAGHEVSAHTYSHPTIERSPLAQVIPQIMEDRKILEEAVGYPVRGLSYPNGSYNPEIMALLPSCGIEYARVVETTGSFGLPKNFHEWKGTCHHNQNLLELGKQFINLFKTQYLYLMYVWGHSYEFDTNDNWHIMEDFCTLTGGRDDIWYTTNIDFVDYMNAAKNLKFNANNTGVLNLSSISVSVSVNNQIFTALPGSVTSLT